MEDLKDLERQRGELLREKRTAKRDEALDALARLQRRIVYLMGRDRKQG